MASVNKVILIGNLGKDPEVRYLPDGAAVVNMSVATTSKWKDKNSGEKKEETEWHRITIYGRLAEVAGEYCKKGKPVYIEGRLKTRKWQDNDGNDRYTTEIIADAMQLLGGRDGVQQDDGGFEQHKSAQQSQQRQQSAPQRSSAPQSQDDLDDDIPF